jgi:hypothetical protein
MFSNVCRLLLVMGCLLAPGILHASSPSLPTTPGKAPYLGWEMRAGQPKSTIQISDMGTHYAVMMKDKVYDAFTGPEGMVLGEYLKRLVAHGGGPRWEMVGSL